MSAPYAVLALEDGSTFRVFAGTVIGRLMSSPLPIHGPGVSEAHALLSHRGESLQLISLGPRPLVVEGQRGGAAVRLEPGLSIELAPQVVVRVVEVHLPDRVIALEVAPRGREEWSTLGVLGGAEYYSVVTEPTARLVSGLREEATWQVVSNAEGYALLGDGGAAPISEGLLDVRAGCRLRAARVPLARVPPTKAGPVAARACTLSRQGEQEVLVCSDRGEETVIRHRPGAVLAALLDSPRPVGRQHLIDTLFAGNRSAFDTALSRLRAELKASGADPQLVISCSPNGEPRATSGLLWVTPPHRHRAGPLRRRAGEAPAPLAVTWDGRPLLPVALSVDEGCSVTLVALDGPSTLVWIAEHPISEDTLGRLQAQACRWTVDPEGLLQASWMPELSGGPLPSLARVGHQVFVLACAPGGELPGEVRRLADWWSRPERPIVQASIQQAGAGLIEITSRG